MKKDKDAVLRRIWISTPSISKGGIRHGAYQDRPQGDWPEYLAAKPVDSVVAVESSLPPESESPITPEQLEQGRKYIHESFGHYADPLMRALCAEQSVPPHEHKSVPSGQRDVWDAAIEIVEQYKQICKRETSFQKPTSVMYTRAVAGIEAAKSILNEIEDARDTTPASTGYDQLTIKAAAEIAKGESEDQGEDYSPDVSPRYIEGWKACAAQIESSIRALATTPAGEK